MIRLKIRDMYNLSKKWVIQFGDLNQSLCTKAVKIGQSLMQIF